MKVLITDPLSEEGIDHLKQQTGLEVIYQPELPPDALLSEVRDAEALIVRSKTQVTREVIEAGCCLRVIGRAGAGVDNIDLAAATRKGVVVMNTPGGNSTSAAEHAFGLLLAMARKIPFADASLRGGDWKKKALVGQELQNKTLAIIGLGKIGSILAQRAQSFHMKVVAYDPFVSEKYAGDLDVELLSLEELLSRSDFVSLHVPLNEKTQGLICERTLKLMKKGALLINTARGGLVVEEDLAAALEEDQLGGAALDVFENEPNIPPALVRSDATVLTPHIAGSTAEAQSKVGYDIAVQVANYLQHEMILNAVNFPSMTSKELEHIQPYLRLGEKLGSFVSQISQIRISEIGIRYYGDLTQVNYKPISNYILKAILKPILSEEINQVNARNYAEERGISVIETMSSRQRSYSNLISIQLRSPQKTEWIEGAILRKGNLRLVSIDGIPVETELGKQILFIRNEDTPGVIGRVGTILGEARINIASFVLGRDRDQPHAVGVVNTDGEIPEEVLQGIHNIAAVKFAQVIHL
ncbi:phosphoglycerate dehydrogenase [Acidobacteria bacterium AH-259-G07]|nr:phosphoglycerate dehydrogenase [Acidobacteria bacterium AH-259-G07]